MATITQSEAMEGTRRTGAIEIPPFVDGLILVASVLSYGLLSLRVGKDANWDLFNYHFYNGWAAWSGLSFANMAPAQLQSFFNPALDIPQYLAIAHLSPPLVGFIIGAIQGTNVFLVFAIVRDLGRVDRTVPAMATAIGAGVVALTGPLAASELGATMGDLTLTVPVLLGVSLTVRAFRSEDRRRAGWKIIGAGLCLGAAVGIKHTNGSYAIATAGALLIRPPPLLSRLGVTLCLSIAGTAAFLGAAGPWMIALYEHDSRVWGLP